MRSFGWEVLESACILPGMKLELEKHRAVALDFDGTLADTIPAHTAARVQAFDEMGIIATPEQHELAHRAGNTPQAIIGNLLILARRVPEATDLGADPFVARVVGRKNDIYRERALRGLDENAGAVEFFGRCIDMFGEDKVSIVTTARTDEVQAFLRRYGLLQRLRPDLLISHDVAEAEGIAFKPAPDMYTLAARRMGVEAADMLVVEDSPGGVTSGVLAGAPVLVMGTTNPHDVFFAADRGHGPRLFAPSFSDIELVS